MIPLASDLRAELQLHREISEESKKGSFPDATEVQFRLVLLQFDQRIQSILESQEFLTSRIFIPINPALRSQLVFNKLNAYFLARGYYLILGVDGVTFSWVS
jgi:hypothetical protein